MNAHARVYATACGKCNCYITNCSNKKRHQGLLPGDVRHYSVHKPMRKTQLHTHTHSTNISMHAILHCAQAHGKSQLHTVCSLAARSTSLPFCTAQDIAFQYAINSGSSFCVHNGT